MVYHNYYFVVIALVLHHSYWLVVVCDCGDANIDYPFVLKGTKNSMVNENFVITCLNDSNSRKYSSNNFKPKAFLDKFNLEVIATESNGFSYGFITVKIPVARNCERSGTSISLDLSGSPFYVDTSANVFASVGCDGNASLYAYISGGHQIASCSSRCNIGLGKDMIVDGSGCNGYHCCQSDLRSAPPFQRYTVSINTGANHQSCRAGFLTSRISLQSNSSIAHAMSAQSAAVPVVLHWNFTFGTGTFGTGSSNEGFSIPPAVFLPGILTLAGASCCFWLCWLCKTKRKRKEAKLRAKYFTTRLEEEWSSDMDVAKKTQLFRLKDLREATNNFDEDRILGRGGQGTVYKGMLKNGQVIAVKKSGAFDERHWKQFINEVILLSKINHRNVVKLLGCCLGTKAPMLVYEFIPHGTLLDYIHKSEPVFITWEMRIRIAAEVAGAFSYLHSSLSTPIYHRDIKSTNILLDENYRAKVADFGISRFVSIDQTHMTTGVQGTFGYLDPEYCRFSRYSEKSEVYSFGVILVELLTRQHPVRVFTTGTAEEDEEERSLVVYFVSSMNESRLEEILDPIILEESKMEDIMVVADLAKRCLKPRGMDRPTMREVAMELESLWKRIYSISNVNVSQQALFEIKSVATRTTFEIDNAHTSPIILYKGINSTVGNPQDDEQQLRVVTR